MQVRIARASADLLASVRFYRDGLGFPVLGGFEAHDGYDGVMIGLPDARTHLELTHHASIPASTPGKEDLLVFYLDEVAERDAVVARLERLGHQPVTPENPYWIGKAVTFRDPDGFFVVLFAGPWRSSPDDVPERFRPG